MKSKVIGDKRAANKILKDVLPTPVKANRLSDEQKVKKIEKHFEGIMDALGLDRADDSLADTPRRVAEMYVFETFKGLKPENFPRITAVDNKLRYDQMIVEKDIKVMSVCEHHFVTIDGRCQVAYIPNDKVIGLSKMNRIVDYFSRRPQIQERLTMQIADALCVILGTKNVAVTITAKHYCVISRGVEDVNSSTTTSELRGKFKTDPTVRQEFLQLQK